MRYWWAIPILAIVLVACGGPAPTPTANAVATETRIAEVAQLATANAPTATPTITPLPTSTATLRPPTPTSRFANTPTPASTATPATQKWHDLPIPAGATFSKQLTDASVLYVAPQNELTVSAFMKREWEALGLRFINTQLTSNFLFYNYSYPSDPFHMVGYAVSRNDANSSNIILIDNR